MWDCISDRVLLTSRYIAQTGDTVRGCAKKFNVSKSTVHKDVTVRLKEVDASLYLEVRRVLNKNLSERHIRGGMATKSKYGKK